MKKRLQLELKILSNFNIKYIFNNNIITIYTNIGILYIELNNKYPFIKPNIYISSYLKYIFNILYYTYNLNFNICIIIISKLQKKIFIKQYIYNLLYKNIRSKWCSYFDTFYNNWSPSLWIITLLNLILNINHINNKPIIFF